MEKRITRFLLEISEEFPLIVVSLEIFILHVIFIYQITVATILLYICNTVFHLLRQSAYVYFIE